MNLQRAAVARLLHRLMSNVRDHEKAHLRTLRGPRYGTDPTHPGLIVRADEDGTRTYGRFEDRTFVPAAPTKSTPPG